MKRPEPPSASAGRNSLAAAAWVERRERGLTAAEQDEFLQWLAADPLHGQWLALHQRTVDGWTRLADWRPEHSQRPNPDLLAPPMRRQRWLLPSALTAAACLALAAVWWQPWPGKSAPPIPAEAVTGYERRILEDGSAVELNRGAVIDIRLDAAERRVLLLRGEALFNVARDTARPFVVHAHGIEVRAVGTEFNVRLDAATMEVIVTEGRVQVTPLARPNETDTLGAATLDSGHRAVVSLTSARPPQISAVTPEQTARLLAWQPQVLDFSSTPLDRVVAEFNRRNRVQLVLVDPALAEIRIVATVRSNNIDGLLRFLADDFGVQATPGGQDEILLRRE